MEDLLGGPVGVKLWCSDWGKEKGCWLEQRDEDREVMRTLGER